MRVQPEISARIAAAVQQLGSETWPDQAGLEHGAIPLWADIGGAILLRPDGTVLELEWDQPSERVPRELEAPSWSLALVAGAERYPWLADLLPQRPTDATSCPDCEGKGRRRYNEPQPGGLIYCATCDGLGWRAV